jgi:hypothetical protein
LVETVEHGLEARDVGGDVDDVGRDVATALFEDFELRGVGGEDFVGRGLVGDAVGDGPAILVDAERFEEIAHGVGGAEEAVFGRDADECHGGWGAWLTKGR